MMIRLNGMGKKFKGKAIYNPSGKAGEYSYWACNFYVGCSNGCTYCYLKKGRGKAVLGGDKPVLKKCFKDHWHAIDIFAKEMVKNKIELQKHGLFFSFTTDPLLMKTRDLTIKALSLCLINNIPVKILTKTYFPFHHYFNELSAEHKKLLSIGFTLTGMDEMEPNASPNHQRRFLMRECKSMGLNTFASIEPIIDFDSSKNMILRTLDICDLYKIGLESGTKYKKSDVENFVQWLKGLNVKIYLKDSITSKIDLSYLGKNFVGRDYNL